MKITRNTIAFGIPLAILGVLFVWGVFIKYPQNVARAEAFKQRFYDECLKYEPVYKCQVHYRNLTRSGR